MQLLILSKAHTFHARFSPFLRALGLGQLIQRVSQLPGELWTERSSSHEDTARVAPSSRESARRRVKVTIK